MAAPVKQLDPELMHARWVLNGLNPEDMIQFAMDALELGFDGTALRQLAGLTHLVKPAFADLEDLPMRAFADMGLKPIDKEGAVDLLLSRGAPFTNSTMAPLLAAFPDFLPRWRKHLEFWGGEVHHPYTDLAEFVHYVVEDLYEHGRTDDLRRAFAAMEDLLKHAPDEEVTNQIVLGFFETLENYSSWRPYGNQVFVEFMGPVSREAWAVLAKIWAGKSSLMDVLRAEREG